MWGRAVDLLRPPELEFGGGISNSGRSRLLVRLMASLLVYVGADRILTPVWSRHGRHQHPVRACLVWRWPRGCDEGRLRALVGFGTNHHGRFTSAEPG